MERLADLTVGLATEDAALQDQARQAAREIIARDFLPGAIPACIANRYHLAIQEITGNPDPFAAPKATQTAYLARMWARIAPAYGQDLESLLMLAVLGNVIDFFRTEAEVHQDFLSPSAFHICRLEDFRERLAGPPGLVLYLADNAGEQLFDRPLVEFLRAQGRRVLYVVKGGPIQNDLTREDLYASGLGEAMDYVKEVSFHPDVILLDLNLPDSRGKETFQRMRQQAPATPLVVFTGLDDEGMSLTAMRGGAQDYLVKHKMNGDLLVRSIRYAIERGKIEQALRLAQQELEKRVEERTAELSVANLQLQENVVQLKKAQGDLEGALLGTVQALSLTVESRDPYTAGHQRRVAELSCTLGRRLGLPEDRLKGMYLAAMVHDLGKISIPAEILSKPGKLSKIEMQLIKNHPQAGFDILKDTQFPWPIARIILQHHERLDGSGYPHGLSGGEILMEARIIGVADVVEAMCSHRPYRPALDVRVAKDEIWSNQGVLYDPDVAGILFHHFDEIWQSLEEGNFSSSIMTPIDQSQNIIS